MQDFDATLQSRLVARERAHLRRDLRRVESRTGTRLAFPAGTLVDFSSNDYLALAQDPRLVEAACEALRAWGSGTGASRLVCGSLAPFHELESDLAAFKSTASALAFTSGYATALGTIPALVGPGDFVVIDRLAHASLVDAARLSRAQLRVFRHNDVADLERILRWIDGRGLSAAPGPRPAHTLVVTESVFSMDGDRAPLREIAEVTSRRSAWLMVDEAHATGWLGGQQRSGLVEELDLGGSVDVVMGTLGKALGAAGGFVAGSRELVDLLVNRARSFIFSTAPPPSAAAAARAAIRIVRSPEGAELAGQLMSRSRDLHAALTVDGWNVPPAASPILPIIVGSEESAQLLAAALRDEGVFVPAIRFPTVARGKARLRVTVSAAHAPDDLAILRDALRRARDRTGIRTP